mmetsp:Transcript_1909/g.11696  ORF Transcript_1909/g.11696 Transcript_1909/m.11696 type:complete len:331 (-) Transcript_1909:2561-3553(-)
MLINVLVLRCFLQCAIGAYVGMSHVDDVGEVHLVLPVSDVEFQFSCCSVLHQRGHEERITRSEETTRTQCTGSKSAFLVCLEHHFFCPSFGLRVVIHGHIWILQLRFVSVSDVHVAVEHHTCRAGEHQHLDPTRHARVEDVLGSCHVDVEEEFEIGDALWRWRSHVKHRFHVHACFQHLALVAQVALDVARTSVLQSHVQHGSFVFVEERQARCQVEDAHVCAFFQHRFHHVPTQKAASTGAEHRVRRHARADVRRRMNRTSLCHGVWMRRFVCAGCRIECCDTPCLLHPWQPAWFQEAGMRCLCFPRQQALYAEVRLSISKANRLCGGE